MEPDVAFGINLPQVHFKGYGNFIIHIEKMKQGERKGFAKDSAAKQAHVPEPRLCSLLLPWSIL